MRRSSGLLSPKETLVLESLRAESRPHSAYELIDKLRDRGVTAPATVYRALDRLIALGHVHRLESLNAYVACAHGHCAAQATAVFAICDDCGLVEEIVEPSVTADVGAWAAASRFAVRSVTCELHGQCHTCRGDAKDPIQN